MTCNKKDKNQRDKKEKYHRAQLNVSIRITQKVLETLAKHANDNYCCKKNDKEGK